MAAHLEFIFPNLNNDSYRITSSKTPGYNCVAWAADNNSRWWWPIAPPFAYWPTGDPREETLENFTDAFRELGYQPCDNDLLEAKYEKITIYVDSSGTPTHVAKQLRSGKWTSKLGSLEDIEHDTLEQLEGPYGVAF